MKTKKGRSSNGENDMTEKNTEQLKFKYVIPDNISDRYVNGLWGGVTPRNEINIHFYSERHPIPKESIYKKIESAEANQSEEHVFGGDVIRLIQSSIVMELETAIGLRNWLDDKIDFILNKSKIQQKEE
jgi:hypothetical protein